jgi:xanthine dehydrogenase iron-sulfur cluster and FAD-binding subunit A
VNAIHGDFFRPESVEETCALLGRHLAEGTPTVLLAGGTDFVVEEHLAPVKAQPRAHAFVVDVSSLRELQAIEERGDVVRLGGGVTYLTLRTHARLVERLPILAAMSKDVGAIQIQARGTLAGNLATASPAADGVCALAALDAVVGLQSVRGLREVPLETFYLGYKKTERAADELIAFVDVRVPKPEARWQWRKVGTRLAQAISKVALAAVAEIDGGVVTRARFGMASVAATTAFLPNVRASIEGTRVDAIDPEDAARALSKDIAPIDDVRSTGDYRMHVARALVRNFVVSLRG